MPRQKTYYDLLRDPRWQRKRLEVMERAGFCCEYCDNDQTTLNIHHTYYVKGFTPWEYPDESLVCLCEPCHTHAQSRLDALHECIGLLGVHAELDQVIGYAKGLIVSVQHTAGVLVSNHAEAQGVGHIFGLIAEEVIDALSGGWVSGKTLNQRRDQKSYESFREFYDARNPGDIHIENPS